MVTIEAVIEIGSTSIRLLVCEVDSQGTWKTVDSAELTVSLGWDIFTTGLISKESFSESKSIFEVFKEKLTSWGIEPFKVKTIATSALREAKNLDAFFDRILLKTGFPVSLIDEVEEMRLIYLAGLNVLQKEAPEKKDINSIILDVGGCATDVIVLEKGKISAAHNFRLGTIITDQYIKSIGGTQSDTKRYLEECVKKTGGSLNIGMKIQKTSQLITMDVNAWILVKQIGTLIDKKTATITRDAFLDFIDQLKGLSYEEICAKFQLKYIASRSFPLKLLIYKMFLELTEAETILVLDTSVREGLFVSKFTKDQSFKKNINSQIVASAIALGRKYCFDEKHAKYVRDLALKIYDTITASTLVSPNAKLFLEVACLLHDIGFFINGKEHEMHSYYILSNSNIFGLDKLSLKIISLTVQFHNEAIRIEENKDFLVLPRRERMGILKLTAILRIANAVDRSQTQRTGDIKLSLQDNTLSLITEEINDINLEKKAIANASNFFETIFGYNVILR